MRVIINFAGAVAPSVLGQDYVVMWDADGAMIHIHQAVIKHLYDVVFPHEMMPTIDVGDIFKR